MKSLGFFCAVLISLLGTGVIRAENLLIITADTLRADRLSCYGYRGHRTPNIDRLAQEGVLFERAFAEVPITLPAHSTIFTGTLPFFHGVRDNAGFALPKLSTTLAELAQRGGFDTAAFISAYVVASQFGLAQGFEVYDEDLELPRAGSISTNSMRRPGSQTTDRFLKWLEGRGEKRFLAWVHLYDPHAPYDGGYDREVQRVDESVGRIREALERRGVLDSTHIFFLADHGESLGEHGESAHGFFIYDSSLRIPWIIRPGGSFKVTRSRVSQPFSLVDVMPTALQLLDLTFPSDLQGRSALGAISGRQQRTRPLYAESMLPSLQFGWSSLRSLREGRYKLIQAPQPELYDVEADPGEKENLYQRERALADRLSQQLERLLKRYQSALATGAAQSVRAEDAEKLAALGYVALSPSKLNGNLQGADPKDRIQVFEDYQSVLSLLHQKPTARVFNLIEGIRKQDPDTRGIDYLEGLARERSGQMFEAVELYKQELEKEPENNLARGALARLYLRLRDPAGAEEQFQQVLVRDPSDFRSRNNLALLLRLRGENETSLSHLEEVTTSAPHYAAGWVNFGIGLAQKGDLKRAEEALRKALELAPDSAAAHFHLGQVLVSSGREAEGRRLLDRAKQLTPG